MAVACSSMEVHDRRLSVSKSSASKISKPSPSHALKALATSAPPSSAAAPPPSRPTPRVVTADPMSFRRVVQELTGTTQSPPAANAGAASRAPSRLQRIAPPPLRTTARSATEQTSHHQPTLLDQMQHLRAPQMLLLQQHVSKVGALPPRLSFPALSTAIRNPLPNLGNPRANPGSEQLSLLESSNSDMSQTLPMLSPHLLSPLPALTPGDRAWANPFEVASQSPKFMTNTSNSLPPLLGLPASNPSTSSSYPSDGLQAKSSYSFKRALGVPTVSELCEIANSAGSSFAHSLPPLLPTLQQQIASNGVLPPWSPSPLPFSPGLFPLSPLPGPPLGTTVSMADNMQLNARNTYGSSYPAMPNDFIS